MRSAEGAAHCFDSLEAASRRLCGEIVREAGKTAAGFGDFRLVLAGGSTPGLLYEMLASESKNPDIPWSTIQIFWGDERFLPPDDPESNYYLAAQRFLNKVPVAPENVHRIQTGGLTVQDSARQYDQLLRKFAGSERSLFDLTILGMGEDGHTASLFPGHPVLNEESSLVAAVEEPAGSPPVPRITLTLAGLARSARICFLIAGAPKRAIMEKIRSGGVENIYPAARVKASDRLDWFAA